MLSSSFSADQLISSNNNVDLMECSNAEWLKGYGMLLIIDHGHGLMSLYAFNQSLYKHTGEWIESGDVIATVGQSGGRNQAGLYFGIRQNGTPVDPLEWCHR